MYFGSTVNHCPEYCTRRNLFWFMHPQRSSLNLYAPLGLADIEDIDRWIAEESIKCHSDHRWNMVEALCG